MKNRCKTRLEVFSEQYHINGIFYDFGKDIRVQQTIILITIKKPAISRFYNFQVDLINETRDPVHS